jgi:hypothetical protein
MHVSEYWEVKRLNEPKHSSDISSIPEMQIICWNMQCDIQNLNILRAGSTMTHCKPQSQISALHSAIKNHFHPKPHVQQMYYNGPRLCLEYLHFFFWGLHPVASITNNLWGCRQSQQYFFWMSLLIFYTHYMFGPYGPPSDGIYTCSIAPKHVVGIK